MHCGVFLETTNLLVSNRDHYNKETYMRKSRTTLIKENSGETLSASHTDIFEETSCEEVKVVKKLKVPSIT